MATQILLEFVQLCPDGQFVIENDAAPQSDFYETFRAFRYLVLLFSLFGYSFPVCLLLVSVINPSSWASCWHNWITLSYWVAFPFIW